MPKLSRNSTFCQESTSTLIDKTLCEDILRQIEDFEQGSNDLSFDMESNATELVEHSVMTAAPATVHSMEQNLQGILAYMKDVKASRLTDRANLENCSNLSRASSSDRVSSTTPVTPLTDRSSPDWMWEERLERFFHHLSYAEAPMEDVKCVKSQAIQTSTYVEWGVQSSPPVISRKTVALQTVTPMVRCAAVQTESEENDWWHAQMKRERRLELKRERNEQRALEHTKGTDELRRVVRLGVKLFTRTILAEKDRRRKALAAQRKHLQQLTLTYQELQNEVPVMFNKATQSEQPVLTLVNVGTQWHEVRALSKCPESPSKTSEDIVPSTALQVIIHTPPRSLPVVVHTIESHSQVSTVSCTTCNVYGEGSEKLERAVMRQIIPNLQLQYADPEVLESHAGTVPAGAQRLLMDGDTIITSTGKEAPNGPRFHRDSSTSLSPIVYQDDSD